MMIKQKIIEDGNIQVIIDWLENNSIRKIFLLNDKNSYQLSGSENYLKQVLNKYTYIEFSDFSENPKIEDVNKGIEILNNEKCDCCIAIGGGSVLDMAKLICYLQKLNSIDSNLILKTKLTGISRKIPLCAIPTTAGSGAESTHFAVVYINNIKYSLAHSSILPDIVSLNSKLSFTLGPYLKAITGLDALAQGIESYWSRNATSESRKYSVKAIEYIKNNLKESVLENSFDSHSMVVEGSNLAGRAINIAQTTAVHAFSYYFTTNHGIKHGHAVALTLGKVYNYNYMRSLISSKETMTRFQELNKILKIEKDPLSELENFISELNIELNFSKLNINIKEELPKIKTEVNIERLRNNPFKLDEYDFDKIFIPST